MACGCNDGSTLGSSVNEINTQTCLPASNCPQVTAPATCGCGCSPCQCGQRGSLPTPYYNQAPGVEECHKQVVVQQSFVTAITTVSTFNIPACNTTATITIPGLNKIQVGSYIWNSIYGYFLVTAFDYLSQQITIKNECTAGNSAPGTPIPACTMFNVVDPPGIGGSGQIGVFVATDFVAPAIGNCIDIQVTGVAGLAVGQNIQIGSGIYRLAGIVSPTIITICNDGSGITPGTVVVAKDGSGQYIVPITPLSSNACDNTVQPQGALLTCHGHVQAPLDAAMIGQIPVVVDATTNEVEFQTLQLPTTVCTTMTSCLVLIAGTTSYTIVVTDSSVFNIGELVIIYVAGYETVRWEVTGKPNPTHLVINRTTPQTINDVIGCDTAQVCLAPCCEQITSGAVICTSDWSKAFKALTHFDLAHETTLTLNVGESHTSPNTTYTIVNDTCNIMHILVTTEYFIDGSIAAESGGSAKYIFTPYFGVLEEAIGGAGVATPTLIVGLQQYEAYTIGGGQDPCSQYSHSIGKSYTHGDVYDLPANRQLKVAANLKLEYTVAKHYADGCCHTCEGQQAASLVMTIDVMDVAMNTLAVAVQAAP